jgi:hypothetical protein
MADPHELARYYHSLSDEGLRSALSDGPAGYTPAAWGTLTREAAARGLPLPAPVAARRNPPAPPLAGRVFAGGVFAGMVVLALNLFRGWHWFGGADKAVLLGFSLLGVYIMMRWFGEDWLEQVRQFEEEKRTGAPRE